MVKGLNKLQSSNIVVAIGKTGSGKSTMLNSIVFGPDKLKTTKINRKAVIDQIDEFKSME